MEKHGTELSDLQTMKTENEKLKNKLNFYEHFMDCSSYWEIFRDKTGKIIYISPNFIKILEGKKKDYLDSSERLRHFIHPDDRREVAENFEKAQRGEMVEKQLSRVIRLDDSFGYITIEYKMFTITMAILLDSGLA